jgi:polysaccharide biosynthesis/export protein
MLSLAKKVLSLALATLVGLCAFGPAAFAQTPSGNSSAPLETTRPRKVSGVTTDTRELNAPEAVNASEEVAIQAQINSLYQGFYNSYRLGPGDVLGIYIDKHPEDTVERVVVSPVGQVYFPLLGNVSVVGKTLSQLQDYFTISIAEFISSPRVTIALLEANSAKIGVLGDVRVPGVLLLTRPMRVLDAITQSGSVTETGNASNISLLRQYEDGRVQMMTIDVKKILKGKANPEENAYLRAGDTIIVHGNLFKKITKISSMVGITGLITFLTRGGR